MKTKEQLSVPTLQWNPDSADKNEVLALARVGVLISAYEPQYYWCDLKHPIANHISISVQMILSVVPQGTSTGTFLLYCQENQV